jgi:hypothetical protein
MSQSDRKATNDHFVVLDAGRSLVKGKTQSSEKTFVHALSQLTETEYKQIMARETSSEIVKVNGIPYAIGKTAMKRGYQPRQTTAERYNSLYYGTLLASMLFQLYEKPVKNIFLYASHPPVSVESRAEIITAAKGKWTVESNGEKREYVVQDVRCFDEPVGGVMNLLLGGDGKTYQRSDIKEGAALVLDIGGQTIDIAALDNGKVDYTAIRSADGGVIEVEQRFEKLLRAEHKLKLKSANFISPEKIRHALQHNVFDAGAFGSLEVSKLVSESTDDIVLRIKDLINEFGGLTAYNNIVLTGGGGGLLYNRLCEYFNHGAIQAELGRAYFHLADESTDVHLANVRGGFKLLKMFQKAGKI